MKNDFLGLLLLLANLSFGQSSLTFEFNGARETYKDESVSNRSLDGLKGGATVGYENKTENLWIHARGQYQAGFYNFDEFNYDDRVAEGNNFAFQASAQKQIDVFDNMDFWLGLQSRYQYEDRSILFFANSSQKDFFIWDTGLRTSLERDFSLFKKDVNALIGLNLPLVAYTGQTPFTIDIIDDNAITERNFSFLGSDYFGIGFQAQPSIKLGDSGNRFALNYNWNYQNVNHLDQIQVDNHTIGALFTYALK